MANDRNTARTTERWPLLLARVAGAFYLLNIITSLVAFSGKGSRGLTVASGLTATVCYIVVSILLYYLFKPVNKPLSFAAALFSLAGCADGVLAARHLLPFQIHSLVFFGCYCLLTGFFIFRSAFLPHFLGVLMAIAGLGWLTFLYRPLAASLSPYHYIGGGIGEGLLTLWLLFAGVNAERWKEQVKPARAPAAVHR